ncbi:hypothetical protein ETAA8_18300 [Anatilimnocola aggregata]|uniref:HPF/RaiA family ribosome-associated protein n=1 Tax=Anatilimnocola aggregata TaxID=2528021 RepID=A0A517Y934_9BACT|nr:hypothetical protein [Anatilimnocola aggregata]QDU26749.1 hypothetical protein ETAA8_18300 [Anatilimnocola aggregata]
MWITIRTKSTTLSPRQRRNVEAFIRRTFQREQEKIASCVLTIGPTKVGGGETGFSCHLKLWSSLLGSVVVRDAADTIRSAVQTAALRARHAARRQLHKRGSQSRRLGHHQLSRWLTGLVE